MMQTAIQYCVQEACNAGASKRRRDASGCCVSSSDCGHVCGGPWRLLLPEEQRRAKKQKYGPRQFLKDMAALPVLKKTVQSLTRVRNALSHLLLLDVDVLKTLGRPDPKKYGARTLNTFPRDPPSRQVKNKHFYL